MAAIAVIPASVTTPAAPTVRPRDGDVVVTRESQSAVHYTIRQLPGIVQFSTAARDEAVRLSRGFAQKHAVDLWYSDNGSYRLLEAYRSRANSHATSCRVSA